jgi:hypothetical protein
MIMSIRQTAALCLMAIPSYLVPKQKTLSSWEEKPSSSSPIGSLSPAVGVDLEAKSPSRYVLPHNLDTALRQLSDADIDKLAKAVLEERTRRKGPLAHEDSHRKRPHEINSPSLPQGKLNAVRAAFKAGVTPSRIAREFGLSRSDVKSALIGRTKDR